MLGMFSSSVESMKTNIIIEKRNKIKFRIGKLTVVEIKGLRVVDTRNKKIEPIKQNQLHQSFINH